MERPKGVAQNLFGPGLGAEKQVRALGFVPKFFNGYTEKREFRTLSPTLRRSNPVFLCSADVFQQSQ